MTLCLHENYLRVAGSQRRHDQERDAVVRRRDGQLQGADLVGGVPVGGNPVGPDRHRVHLPCGRAYARRWRRRGGVREEDTITQSLERGAGSTVKSTYIHTTRSGDVVGLTAAKMSYRLLI